MFETISVTTAPSASSVGEVVFAKLRTSPTTTLLKNPEPVTVLLFAGILTFPIEVQELDKAVLPVPTS